MNLMPIIKLELRRSFWVFWVAVFTVFFLSYADVLHAAKSMVLELTDEMAIYTYIYSGMFEYALTGALIWCLPLVFIQFDKDDLTFKQALPFTDKKLLLGKFLAFVPVALGASAVYLLLMLKAVNDHKFINYVSAWVGEGGNCLPAYGTVFFYSLVLLVFAAALYWYLTLWCAVCRNPLAGCGIGIFGIAAFVAFMNFLNNTAMGERLDNMYVIFSAVVSEENSAAIIVLAVSLAVLAVTVPLAFKAYGKGTYKHPAFKFAAAEAVFNVITALFCGFLFPVIMDFYDKAAISGCICGMLFGGVLAAVIGKTARGRA